MPFFTVIIPLYNKENFIENTLRSVLNQRFTNFEVIIVNDGSTDNSEEKVREFNDNRIKYFYQINQGVSVARNLGILMANSNFITFIDADDYWFPEFLQEMFNNINQFQDQKVFSAATEVETSISKFSSQYSIEKSKDCQLVNYFDASINTTIICTSCAVFHKSVFEKVGTFDTNIKIGEDTDLWIRIGLVYPVVFSSKILARYVFDENSLSKKKMNRNEKLNFDKFLAIEKSNIKLKKFLDLNRYSLAIKCKMNNDKEDYDDLINQINLENLSLKKRVLLYQPAVILKFLIALNLQMVKLGLSNSVFK